MFFRAFIICLFLSSFAQAEIKKVPSSRYEAQLSYAPLVKSAAPAVVNIYTSKTVRTRSTSPLFNDPFFRRFFGDAFRGVPQGGGRKKKVQNSLGSGVIVEANGVVITNHHVIEGADDIKVVLNDRREFEAKLVGSDKRTDLAILQVNTEGALLPTLPLGNSDGLEVGDLVLAIGNPFGVGQTVTSGIVSALARTQVGITDYSFFIQTDAAINPGNSGGALVDMNGRLIGVNSAIYSKGGGSNGIGFAIPVNMVRSVLSGVSETGKVVRPWLGATGQPMTQDLASSFNLARPTGVLIDEVYPRGPADEAGLKRGDIILKIDDHVVDEPQALRFRLATLSLGETAKFEILRRGERKTLTFEALPAPETPKRDKSRLKGHHPFDGAVVVNMSPALNDEIGWDTMQSGVAILKMVRGSTVNRLGFKLGDRITGINGIEVKTVKDLKWVLKRFDGRKGDWLIGIIRKGKRRELKFRG
ncbi:Trypsin-like serine proteases, typically periplasmic, contain C-terminal PDZ domain [Candidatus Terasakiella magnetica]|uniref:Trypsin-like serine proteases, typically periplasmic, contain C-terminal PDZ domain n=1 Tax=Candidatus Terasakiella magnetica TaxID=1867952 RepID=A0A1C3RDA1_9PROT|nr:DegQ family serine endoprotease [Candidatus Terasakiella magnetica]SCA55273.1 Trypsin-like serine proteases, typically periplasmic, contain C-terminal PDZ domain [Candidatus Terasakiella magnetica]